MGDGRLRVPFSCTDLQDDVAGCFEYYAELAEKQDKQLETPGGAPYGRIQVCHPATNLWALLHS